MGNEGWIDEKAQKRLLGFLRIAPNDLMPEEYINASKASVHSEGQDSTGEIAVSPN
jgi:hypothetical protein